MNYLNLLEPEFIPTNPSNKNKPRNPIPMTKNTDQYNWRPGAAVPLGTNTTPGTHILAPEGERLKTIPAHSLSPRI